MKDIQAIVTDLDGTAINSPAQTEVSDRLRAAIGNLEAKGIHVIAATGRSYSFAKKTIDSMGLKSPIIVAAGTQIRDVQTRQEIWSSHLSAKQVEQVKEILKKYPHPIVTNDFTEEEYLQQEGFPVDDLEVSDKYHLIQACFIEEAEARKIGDELGKIKGLTIELPTGQKGDLKDIQIMKTDTTKENAIYKVAEILKIDTEKMIACGDGLNDLKMFKAVGQGVAVANADEELKSQAHIIIDDVKSDGLAKFFEEVLERRLK